MSGILRSVLLFLHHRGWKFSKINPEFRILRLTFYRKSASKCWIRQIKIASLIYFQYVIKQLTILTWNYHCFVVILHVLSFEFYEVQDMGNFELSPMHHPMSRKKEILSFSICYGCSKELSRWDYSCENVLLKRHKIYKFRMKMIISKSTTLISSVWYSFELFHRVD